MEDEEVKTHRELEYKFLLGALTDPLELEAALHQYLFGDPFFRATKCINVAGFDYYYKAADGRVIRFRDSLEHDKELTVKGRASSESLVSRTEVDLIVSRDTTPNDVALFCRNIGFTPRLTVYKKAAIFEVFLPHVRGTVVLYSATSSAPNDLQENHEGVFLEIEVAKNQSSHPSALDDLERGARLLIERFSLSEPINKSLYEWFTGDEAQMEVL